MMRALRHGIGWSNWRLVRFARYYALTICVGLPFLAYVLLCIADSTAVLWVGMFCAVVGVSGALASIVYYHWIVFTYEMLSLEFWGVGGSATRDTAKS